MYPITKFWNKKVSYNSAEERIQMDGKGSFQNDPENSAQQQKKWCAEEGFSEEGFCLLGKYKKQVIYIYITVQHLLYCIYAIQQHNKQATH